MCSSVCNVTVGRCCVVATLSLVVVGSLVRSFVRSLRSFLCSFVPSFLLRCFVPSFVPSFLRSFVRSFLRSFVRSLRFSALPFHAVRSLTAARSSPCAVALSLPFTSSVRSFVGSCVPSFLPSFIHSCARLFTLTRSNAPDELGRAG